jgi:hypothetical protein
MKRLSHFFRTAFVSESELHTEDFVPPRMSRHLSQRRTMSEVNFVGMAKQRSHTMMSRKSRSFSHKKILFDNNDVDLVQMLSVPILHDALLLFAKMDYCDECILLYDDIQRFKSCANTLERKNIAESINEKYFKHGSKYEVNMQESLKDGVKECVTREEVPADMFHAIETEMLNNIRDIYIRFSTNNSFEDDLVERNRCRN